MNDDVQPSATNTSIDDRITGNEVYRDSWRRKGTVSGGDETASIILDSEATAGGHEKHSWRISLRLKKQYDEDNEIESVRSTLSLIAKDSETYRNFQANTPFIIGIVATICCAGFQIGHVIACTNQLHKFFEAKYPKQFTKDGTSSFYHALIGSSGIFGTTIGAISANYFMKIGRRNAFILATLVALGGTIT